ncbi:MAG TPA: hypothetical protein VEO56_11540 [Bacteroidota bacterium]|nr:hypothetical protein [Bacteroidota bacterium]
MKARTTLLVIFALCMIESGFGGGPDYTIKAPDGWKKRTTSSAPEHYMKNGVSLMLTIDSAPPEAKTPDGYVEYAKKQLAQTFKNIQFEPVKKLAINGHDARELRYSCELSSIKMKYDVVYIPKESKVYTITAGGMAETFDSMKAEYQAFFNSFNFK